MARWKQCGVGLEVNTAAKVYAWTMVAEQKQRKGLRAGEVVLIAGVLVPVAGLVLALLRV